MFMFIFQTFYKSRKLSLPIFKEKNTFKEKSFFLNKNSKVFET